MGAAIPKLLPASAPRVVIVGGGFGGVMVARKLDESGKFSVLLIDRKSYFLSKPGTVRTAVEKNWGSNMMIPYSKLLKNGAFLQGDVDELRSDSVVVKGYSTPIRFDYLVIALGSDSDFPGRHLPHDRSSTLLQYDSVYESVRASSTITIVGGGPTGVEVAAEIGTDFPDKKVRIVTNADSILAPNLKPEFKTKVLGVLKKMNVEIVYGERVIVSDDQKDELSAARLLKAKHAGSSFSLRTENGREFQQNLAIFATGAHVANAPLLRNFSHQMNDEGRLQVNEFLQVQGFENIFALGDIAGTDQKLAYVAGLQAPVVSGNLLSLLGNKKMKPWKVIDKAMAFIALGRKSGYGQMGDSILGPFIVANMKSKSFFADKYWDLLNAKNMKGSVLAHDKDVVASGRKENEQKEKSSLPNNTIQKNDSEVLEIRTKNLQRFLEVNDTTAQQILQAGIPASSAAM